jgi:hypothetical protein
MKHISIIVALLAFSGNAPVGRASSAGSAALKAFREIDYRYFVAGGTCAAISHGITTPIDVVKTRMQASPKVSFSGEKSGIEEVHLKLRLNRRFFRRRPIPRECLRRLLTL